MEKIDLDYLRKQWKDEIKFRTLISFKCSQSYITYLMTAKSEEVKQARQSLIQHAFGEICNVPRYSDFRSNTFCVIAKFGLQLKAKEEKLFKTGDWYAPECKGELLEKVKAFLIKYIK